MKRELFQMNDIGSFPIDVIVENAGPALATDMMTQINKVFVLGLVDYDSATKTLRIRLNPGNGMVPVLIPENDADEKRIAEIEYRSGMQDCE
jgi:hypothetical protein